MLPDSIVPDVEEQLYEQLGGFAATSEAYTLGISAERSDPHKPDPPSCEFTWWQPPHQLALPAELCDQLIALMPYGVDRSGERRGTWEAPTTTLKAEVLGEALGQRVIEPAVVGNQIWWRLHLDLFDVEIKRYVPGMFHPQHADIGPGLMRRKLAMTIQLSDPADYTGGELQLGIGHHLITAPRDRGAVIAFPSWVNHRVAPVLSGVRYALIVMGHGDPIR